MSVSDLATPGPFSLHFTPQSFRSFFLCSLDLSLNVHILGFPFVSSPPRPFTFPADYVAILFSHRLPFWPTHLRSSSCSFSFSFLSSFSSYFSSSSCWPLLFPTFQNSFALWKSHGDTFQRHYHPFSLIISPLSLLSFFLTMIHALDSALVPTFALLFRPGSSVWILHGRISR